MADFQNLQTLLDFSDSKNQKSCTQTGSSNFNETTSENESILRSFKQLRQKLKITQKQNSQLKQQLKMNEIKLRQSQQSLQTVFSNIIELKDDLATQKQANQQLKKRLTQMKETLGKFTQLQQELHYTKNILLEAKLLESSLIEDRNKIMELSIGEKMQLEEEVARLLSKSKSDEEFISDMEKELAMAKENNIKLQNQIRKLTITYEEQIFTNKWSRQNFQTQHLNQTISQLQKQIVELKSKNKKQKQKRSLLQEKLIQLEEISGINQVKANIFQGETQLITKRQNKFAKKLADLNNKLSRKNEQKLLLEQKLTKTSLFFEAFIQKLKLETCGENLNELICQFQNILKSIEQHEIQQFKNEMVYARNKQCTGHISVLQERKSVNFIDNQISSKYLTNLVTKNKATTLASVCDTVTTSRFTFGFQKQNEKGEISGVENKVRKERQQMEKRIREKYMHRKLEASLPSQVQKIRGQYIRSFIDRK